MLPVSKGDRKPPDDADFKLGLHGLEGFVKRRRVIINENLLRLTSYDGLAINLLVRTGVLEEGKISRRLLSHRPSKWKISGDISI
jgi:hypothetical protein